MPRPRLSIRYKMLLVIVVVLLLAMGTYLYLATSLFTRDKLAYIYDLNSSLVETLSEQTRSNLTVLVKELNLFVRDALRSGLSEKDRSAAASELFSREGGIVRVEVFQRSGAESGYVRRYNFVNQKLLEEAGLTLADLELTRRRRPLPLEAIAEKTGRVYLQNSSLPPDAAILTQAVAYPSDAGPLVVACDFRHERLLRIFGRSKLHETYLVDERGEILAHPDAAKVIGRSNMSNHALVREAIEAKMDRGVREFTGEDGASMLGAYAKVGIGRLSVLTQIPKSVALRASRELIHRSVLFAVAILIAAFVASVFFSRLLTAPIRRLRAATEVIGKGRFDVDVKVRSRDEIGDLARSFEMMATALKETQAQLVRSEKMAAFGQLGAGITHEVKNPMTGIIGFAQMAKLKMNNPEKVAELLDMIEKEGKRCKEILVNFLKLARYQTKDFERLDINELVQESAKIVHHQLMTHKVKLEVELGENVPPVSGNTGELQQVLLNLALNAQQAMPEGGVVQMTTGSSDGRGSAVIAVSDNGPGIPEDIQQRIFEPFFTTRPVGEGTGLGLSISFGIIRDHKGTISIQSQVGRGTTFSIRLPALEGVEAP